MYYTQDEIMRFIQGLRVGAHDSQGSHVIIFVSLDVDSLCALRILTYVLKLEFIRYTVKPVADYGELHAANRELVEPSEELRSIFLINCGGIVDLSEVFDLLPGLTCYVLDSHRPYNLENVRSDQVIILDDGWLDKAKAEGKLPEIPDDLYGDSDSDSSSDEEDSGSEHSDSESSDSSDSGDDNSLPPPAPRPLDTPMADVDDNTGSTVVDPDHPLGADPDSPDSTNSKRGRDRGRRRLGAQEVDAEKRRKRRKKRKKKLEGEIMSYYEGTGFGTSAASLLYHLSAQLNKQNNQLLWWGIVGMTDLYIHERLKQDIYLTQVEQYVQEVNRMNADVERPIIADDGTEIPVAPDEKIEYGKEMRFHLLRHWNLYEAMYHSVFIASHLAVWGDKGRQSLDMLLAKMGVAKKEAEGPYSTMGTETQLQLRERFHSAIEQFPTLHLDDFTFGSFYRRHGFRFGFSAADVVFAVSAILESPPRFARARTELMATLGSNAVTEEDIDVRDRRIEERFQAVCQENFWEAHAALDPRTGLKKLSDGIELAVQLQKDVLVKGTELFNRNALRDYTAFRYTCIEASAGLGSFARPLTLTKLALFVMSAVKQTGKTKPFVISVLDETTRRYVVMGWWPSHDDRNKFGAAFRNAAAHTGARMKHVFFDSAMIEIPEEDMGQFTRSLYGLLNIA